MNSPNSLNHKLITKKRTSSTARADMHGKRTIEWMIENGFPVDSDKFSHQNFMQING